MGSATTFEHCQRPHFTEPDIKATSSGDMIALFEHSTLPSQLGALDGIAVKDFQAYEIKTLSQNGGAKAGSGKDPSSRPPSPPESGATTPRVTIAPCPIRLQPYIPPPNYGTVDVHKTYRSSFPQDRHMDFVKSMKIRSVLTLVATEPSTGYQQWLSDHSINQVKIDIAPNKDGNVNTTFDSLCEALLFIMDSSNYPIYIHCNQGKHRTGCVVACLRKVQRMPMEEILAEYHAYAYPKAREGDIALIKSFNPEVVFEYAKANGYIDGPEPLFKRTDSGITNIDALAEALSSGAMKESSPLPEDQLRRVPSAISTASSVVSDGPIELSAPMWA